MFTVLNIYIDVSNTSFRQRQGFAMILANEKDASSFNDAPEVEGNAEIRQKLFENLTTQDDHLMHIVGLEKSKGGKKFFMVMNSWGEVGPYKGFIQVSERYFAINTIVWCCQKLPSIRCCLISLVYDVASKLLLKFL